MAHETAPTETATRDQPTIFGTGLLALDVIVQRECDGDPILAAGGTCGNVLAALSFFGWTSYPVARLNGDEASKLLRRDLARCGVLLDFATEVPEAETPIILQTIRRRESGPTHSFSLVCPACGSWFPRFKAVRRESAATVLTRLRESSAPRSPQVFFFDRVSRAALVLAEQFSQRGAVVVFEPSGTGNPGLFEEALGLAHILKYSGRRMPGLSARSSGSENRVLEVETQGAKGLRFRSPLTSWSWQVSQALDGPSLVDAAGAGDWCTAGVLEKLAARGLDGLQRATVDDLQAALRFGQAAAAIGCGYAGARGAMLAFEPSRFRMAASQLSMRTASWTELGALESSGASSGRYKSPVADVCPSCD